MLNLVVSAVVGKVSQGSLEDASIISVFSECLIGAFIIMVVYSN